MTGKLSGVVVRGRALVRRKRVGLRLSKRLGIRKLSSAVLVELVRRVRIT